MPARRTRSLQRASEDAGRGDLRGASRRVWPVGIEASRDRHAADLEAVLVLARSIADQGDDAVRDDMGRLIAFCEASLVHVRSGVRSGTVLQRLLMRDRSTEIAAKRCPDCAELVQSAARICRFCGYEFAPPPGEHEPLSRP